MIKDETINVTFSDWDPAEHLKTPEDRAAYIEAAAEEGTPDAIPDAFGDVFRALGRNVEAAACDSLAGYLRALRQAIPKPTRRRAAKRLPAMA